jgi:hypothetical protein
MMQKAGHGFRRGGILWAKDHRFDFKISLPKSSESAHENVLCATGIN